MVVSQSPAESAGGVKTVVRTLHQGLSAQHTVSILINDWSAKRLSEANEAGMRMFRMRMRAPYDSRRPVAGFVAWLRDFPATMAALRRLVGTQQIDVIHLHFAASYQYYFRLLRWLGGPPYVITLHGSDIVNHHSRSRIDRWLVEFSLRGASQVVAVSHWLAGVAANTMRRCPPITVIHNGMDIGAIDASARASDTAPEVPEPYFLSVSNITHYKGIDVAIRAWPLVREQVPDLHLVVAGEPREQWAECQGLLDDLGCRDRVHLIGTVSHAAALQLMRRAGALVFPSRSEGLGLVILEAGALALPVACTSIAPVLEIVSDGQTALVVPPDDPVALANAVVRLAQDHALARRLGQALQDRVRGDFTAERMTDQYLDLYHRTARTT